MQDSIKRKGLMLVLSSPSGAGKTTIARALLAKDNQVQLSVSVTTRPIRKGEVHGKDYHFENQKHFEERLQSGGFLEHAKVFGNYYGTSKQSVEEIITSGKDVLLDIDWQGTQQLQEKCAQDLITVFILPPSIQALEDRLNRRATDTKEVVEQRMTESLFQISHWPEYDYVIINRDLDKSIKQIELILKAERLKRHRQVGLVDFVNKMRKKNS
ncbi:MAG: guanylate kinase [Alphaproteobacteria bacterium CG_4_10_14_0_8_um_filter_37_21]|nr:MAG: guanylate kinase [Alphaproteobacteria bacterium CG_4_10_14_0_8_um_filter_37_21]